MVGSAHADEPRVARGARDGEERDDRSAHRVARGARARLCVPADPDDGGEGDGGEDEDEGGEGEAEGEEAAA
jgi:hypothetical protein